MAHLDHPAFFTLECKWDEEESLPDKVHFDKTLANDKRLKGRVTPDKGEWGPEFILGTTLTEFNELQQESAYPNHEKWTAFRKCLVGDVKTTWDEVVDKNYKYQSTRTTDEFKVALEKFITKLLNCDYSRDV